MQTIGFGIPDNFFNDCSSGVVVIGASGPHGHAPPSAFMRFSTDVAENRPVPSSQESLESIGAEAAPDSRGGTLAPNLRGVKRTLCGDFTEEVDGENSGWVWVWV